MQKQIKLNEDFQNQIQEEIENSSPFISDLTPIDIVKAEYQDNFKFEQSFLELQKRYSRVRRLRRDGNCFYRAYLFQVFEFFINATGTTEAPTPCTQYEAFLKTVENSKKELTSMGYDEIAVEDFYDIFLEKAKKLREIEPKDAEGYLHSTLSNKEEANYLIMYARFLTSCYLKQNSFLFEDFVGDIPSFCMREVEAVNVECDHPQIIAITNYLGVGVEINSVGPKGNMEVIRLPEDDAFDKEGYFRSRLLYVPGHYDALY